MPDRDRPRYSFDPGPPTEASRYLTNKGLKPSFAWQDVEPEEHAVAFTVAKAMEVDVLEDIRGAVQAALDQGQTFEQFKKDLRPLLEAKGWWGRKDMIDPVTGETVSAQLGSPRRLRTIYRANLRSARAAGQWERIERTKSVLPYLLYQLGPSERHRPHHAEKEGLVLPVDDPFWSSWFPPNGWGCKCWVRQITPREASERGVDKAPDPELRDWRNPRTGEVRKVPDGIDPGWDRNPGALRLEGRSRELERKLEAADAATSRVIARDMATSWRAARILAPLSESSDEDRKASVPIALLPGDLAARLGAAGRVVRIGRSYGAKIGTKAAPVTPEVLGRAADALYDGPALIDAADGQATLQVLVDGKDPWVLVVKNLPEAGELWVRTMHRFSARKWRALARRTGITVLRD